MSKRLIESVRQPNLQSVHVVAEPSQIAAARRAAGELGRRLGFTETQAGRLAIVVTEAGTNLVKHAQEGRIILRPVEHGDALWIEVLAIDRGPGIANLGASLHDGVTTGTSPGTGLGAMQRLSSGFDAYTAPGKGSAFLMLVAAGAEPLPAARLQVGAVCLPIPSEDSNGDGWSVAEGADHVTIMVADGLGHGPDAHLASSAATTVLEQHPDMTPQRLLDEAHGALRATRGAAVAVARVEFGARTVHFAGIGNIATYVLAAGMRRQLMSHNGIVGNNMRKVQEFTAPFEDDALLLMHSDGLMTQWDLMQYPGLEMCHPALVAAVLYRDFCRGRDDVAVVAARRSVIAGQSGRRT